MNEMMTLLKSETLESCLELIVENEKGGLLLLVVKRDLEDA